MKLPKFIYVHPNWPILVFAFFALLCALAAGWFLVNLDRLLWEAMTITPAPPEERRADMTHDDIDGDMRGGEILSITFPKNAEPREIITVYKSNEAWRGVKFERGSSKRIVLTDTEWQTLTTAIDQWCAALPQFRELAPDEPRYSVNIRCSWMYKDTRFFRVPVDQVTPELMMLIEKEPVSLQHRSTCIQREQHISGERYATGLVSLW